MVAKSLKWMVRPIIPLQLKLNVTAFVTSSPDGMVTKCFVYPLALSFTHLMKQCAA